LHRNLTFSTFNSTCFCVQNSIISGLASIPTTALLRFAAAKLNVPTPQPTSRTDAAGEPYVSISFVQTE